MGQIDSSKALFLTWRTYGTWLPGDERGWVDERRNGRGEPMHTPDSRLEAAARGLMRFPAVVFSEQQRRAVEEAIHETCESERWNVLALNVRTNHVHLVLASDQFAADAMVTLKKEVTKRLRLRDLTASEARIWSRGGSHRALNGEESIGRAVDYVLNRQ